MHFQDNQPIAPNAVVEILKRLVPTETDYTITFGSTVCHRNTGANWTDLETEVSPRLITLTYFTVTYPQDDHRGVAKFEKNAQGYFDFDFSLVSIKI